MVLYSYIRDASAGAVFQQPRTADGAPLCHCGCSIKKDGRTILRIYRRRYIMKTCSHCGAEFGDGAAFCIRCGAAFPAQQSADKLPMMQQPYWPQQPYGVQPPYGTQLPYAQKDSSTLWLVLNILCAVFLSLIFGVIGAVFASQSGKSYQNGLYEEAARKLKTSRILFTVGTIVGAIATTILIINIINGGSYLYY